MIRSNSLCLCVEEGPPKHPPLQATRLSSWAPLPNSSAVLLTACELEGLSLLLASDPKGSRAMSKAPSNLANSVAVGLGPRLDPSPSSER